MMRIGMRGETIPPRIYPTKLDFGTSIVRCWELELVGPIRNLVRFV